MVHASTPRAFTPSADWITHRSERSTGVVPAKAVSKMPLWPQESFSHSLELRHSNSSDCGSLLRDTLEERGVFKNALFSTMPSTASEAATPASPSAPVAEYTTSHPPLSVSMSQYTVVPAVRWAWRPYTT